MTQPGGQDAGTKVYDGDGPDEINYPVIGGPPPVPSLYVRKSVDRELVYHETQRDAQTTRCGANMLNSLLQGYFFNDYDLSQFAQGLDEREKQMMVDAGMDQASIAQMLAEGSSNMTEDGQYGAQVLTEALKSVGLSMCTLDAPEAKDVKQSLDKQLGYIAHADQHWFSLRRIGCCWYNMDSKLEMAEPTTPRWVTQLVSETRRPDNMVVYVIQGTMPPPRYEAPDPNLLNNWKRPLTVVEQARVKHKIELARQHALGNDSNFTFERVGGSAYDDEDLAFMNCPHCNTQLLYPLNEVPETLVCHTSSCGRQVVPIERIPQDKEFFFEMKGDMVDLVFTVGAALVNYPMERVEGHDVAVPVTRPQVPKRKKRPHGDKNGDGALDAPNRPLPNTPDENADPKEDNEEQQYEVSIDYIPVWRATVPLPPGKHLFTFRVHTNRRAVYHASPSYERLQRSDGVYNYVKVPVVRNP